MNVRVFMILICAVLLLISCGGQSKRVADLSDTFSSNSQTESSNSQADPGLMRMLTEKFWEERARITAESPPSVESTDKVLDLTCEEAVLRWSYRNVGDYDQSGMVGIPDITMIAQHYLHRKDEGGVWTDESDEVIDGDGDGEVGVSDVTPIAVNYLKPVTNYSIDGADSPDGSFSQVGGVLVENGEMIGGRLRFAVEAPSGPDAPAYLRVWPYHRYGAGKMWTPSDPVLNPPVIVGVTPTEAVAGTSVEFAVETAGTQPEIYRWVLGDALFPAASMESSSRRCDLSMSDAVGDYSAYVEIENAVGTDRYDFSLTLRDGTWESKDLPVSASADRFARMAIANWSPFIAYFDSGENRLKVITALDEAGDSWSEPVDVIYDDVRVCSAACINGFPAILYSSYAGSTSLNYIRSLDFLGNSWPTEPELIRFGLDFYSVLYELYIGQQKNPGMAEINTGQLRVWTHGDWQFSYSTGASTSSGAPAALYLEGKNLVIYDDRNPSALKLLRMENFGTGWTVSEETLDPNGGRQPQLQVCRGFGENACLVVSYISEVSGALRCAVSTDTSGAVWHTPIVVYAPGNEIVYQSLLGELAGRPAIAYLTSSGELFFVRALNSSGWGEAWSEPRVIATGVTNSPISMQLCEGSPAVVYFSSLTEPASLRFARQE